MINTLRMMILGAALGVGVVGCSSDAPSQAPAAPNSKPNAEQGGDGQGSGSTTEPAEPGKGSGSSD